MWKIHLKDKQKWSMLQKKKVREIYRESKETKKWSERVKDLQHEKRLTEVRERVIDLQVKREKKISQSKKKKKRGEKNSKNKKKKRAKTKKIKVPKIKLKSR